MTEMYCGRGFESDRRYCGLLWFSTLGSFDNPFDLISARRIVRKEVLRWSDHIYDIAVTQMRSARAGKCLKRWAATR